MVSAFLDNFNPFRQDILYGISASRETYVFAFIEKEYANQTEQVKAHYRDPVEGETYPDDFASDVYNTIEAEGCYINSYNDPITSGDFSDANRILTAAPTNDRIKLYINSLAQTKYAVENIGVATLRSLAKGDDKLLHAGLDQITAEDLVATRLHLAVRRACKFGIEYIASKSEAVVHYILDGIKPEDVVDKKTYEVMGGGQGVPITTSEIRYMFRKWFELKERAIARKIIFYRDQSEVRAPWYDAPAMWLPYAEHRLDKFLSGNPRLSLTQENAVEAFRRHLTANRPTEALQKFFSLPTKTD